MGGWSVLRWSASLTAALLLTCIGAALARGAKVDSDQAWIARNAIPIRSIDPTDEDFSDLEPLIGAIGAARIVELGEPSHGAGSSFAVKVRLIKFLHARMGFDVIAWESGMYGLQLTQAGLRSGEDAVTAARRGVFGIWSNTEEVRPLFEYAKATQATLRPLEMAGFDMQITAAGADERFAADLHAFTQALQDAALAKELTELADKATSASRLIYAPGTAAQPSQSSDIENVVACSNALLAALSSHRADFAQVHSDLQIAVMAQAIENMREATLNVISGKRPDRPTGAAGRALASEEWNRRDALMAKNLRWLIDEVYRGRKVIVWGHNAHVMKAYFAPDWRSVQHEPQPDGMTSMGAYLAASYGKDVYSIATTTYEGEDAWANGQSHGPVAPAAAGSLESKLHQLGKPYLLLELRSQSADALSPMHRPQSLRVSGYGPPTSPYGNDTVPDVTRAFDAIIFIDHMAPATPIRGASQHH